MEKKEFIKQWMKTYEPDTFKAGENGRYFYRSEDLSSGIDLECFFEDLLTDFESALDKDTKQQCNCNLPDVIHSGNWKCLLCGRDTFTHKTSHKCKGGYRKRNIIWEKIS